MGVVHSDYRQSSGVVERRALVEFLVLQSSENCSLAVPCGFERGNEGCSMWGIGSGVQSLMGNESPVKSLNTTAGICHRHVLVT